MSTHLRHVFTLDAAKEVFHNHEHAPQLNHLAIDPTSDTIIANVGWGLDLFSISGFPAHDTGERRIAAYYVTCLALDPSSGLLAIGGHDSSGSAPLKVFDLRAGKMVWVAVSQSPESVFLRARQQHCRAITLPIRHVEAIDLDPRSGTLVVSSLDAAWADHDGGDKGSGLRMFSLAGQQLGVRADITPHHVKIMPGGTRLAVARGRVLHILDGQTFSTLHSRSICTSDIDGLTMTTEQSLVAISSEGEITCVDDRLEPRWTAQINAIPRCLAFDPQSELLYVGTYLGDLLLLDRNGEIVDSLRVSESIRCLGFLHEGAHVLVGCKNVDLHVFRTNHPLPKGAAYDVLAWEERLRNIPSSTTTSTASLCGARVFISYASADQPFAELLERRLQGDGVRCWRDRRSLVAGRVARQLQRAISHNDVLIVVLSEASIASDWVRWELEQARSVEKTAGRDIICPITIDRAWESWNGDPVLKREVVKYHVLPFIGWQHEPTFNEAYGRLAAGLHQNYLASAEQ